MPDDTTTPEAELTGLPKATAEDVKERLHNQFKKWREAKATKGDIADLLAAKMITPEQAKNSVAAISGLPEPTPDVPNSAVVIPKSINTQTDLAGWLHEYFRDKMSRAITVPDITYWRSGRDLKKVIINGVLTQPPPFPNKTGGRFQVQECIDWIWQYKVPLYPFHRGVGAGGEPTNYKDEMDRLALKKAQRDDAIADGKYKSVSVFNNHLVTFGALANRAITQHMEKGWGKKSGERIKSLADMTEEMKAQVDDILRTTAAEESDALREEIVAAMLAHKETSMPDENET